MQGRLVPGRVRFESTLRPVLTLAGVLGLWWISAGGLWLSAPVAPAGRRWLSGQRRFDAHLGFLGRPTATGRHLVMSRSAGRLQP